jgi:myosin-crossreactive antigen
MSEIQRLQQKLTWSKKQTSYAWAKNYTLYNQLHGNEVRQYNQNRSVLEHSDELPIHLVSEIEELNKKLKVSIECPICMEIIEEGHLKISICGHKFCDDCFPKLDRCGTCRRKFSQIPQR